MSFIDGTTELLGALVAGRHRRDRRRGHRHGTVPRWPRWSTRSRPPSCSSCPAWPRRWPRSAPTQPRVDPTLDLQRRGPRRRHRRRAAAGVAGRRDRQLLRFVRGRGRRARRAGGRRRRGHPGPPGAGHSHLPARPRPAAGAARRRRRDLRRRSPTGPRLPRPERHAPPPDSSPTRSVPPANGSTGPAISARWTPDWTVEFVGRADDQVKINGFRVELGEVEAALADTARRRRGRGRRAARRRTGRHDSTPTWWLWTARVDPAAMRAALADRLPAHLVPPRSPLIPAIPLLPNGKRDRACAARAGALGLHEPRARTEREA